MGNCPSEISQSKLEDYLNDPNQQPDGYKLSAPSNVYPSPAGIYPIPQLFDFYNNCTTTPNIMLPCPFIFDERMQGCSCGGADRYYWDLLNLPAGPQCMGGIGTGGNLDGISSVDLAFSIVMMHIATWDRIVTLCGSRNDPKAVEMAGRLWPHFYHFYNTRLGKCQVDQYIASEPNLPPAAANALKNNFLDDNQRSYGLLNGYDWKRAAQLLQDPSSPDANAVPFVWSLSVREGKGIDDITAFFATKYFRLTIAETDFTGKYFGNPFWDHQQWQEAFREAIGKDCRGNYMSKGSDQGQDFVDEWAQAYVNFGLIGGGKSADDYFDPKPHPGTTNPFTDPEYTGNLPSLVPLDEVGQEMIHRETRDPNGHGYDNQCGSKDITSTLLPIFAGVVGGGVIAMVIPGEGAKILAFGTGAYSSYSVVDSVYGTDALLWNNTPNQYKGEKNAAVALSIGIPVSFGTGLVELEWIPEQMNSLPAKVAFISGCGTVGYFVLKPMLEPLLVEGGAVAEALLSPLTLVTSIVHWIADGCAAHSISFGLVCKCENSNLKPLLSSALLEDLYGVTGEQLSMRKECMAAAMTSDLWGSDPAYMGSCDGKGWMSTPVACVSAGEWAYSAPTDNPKLWDPQLDSLCTPMRAEIAPCLDPYNPSFLPPLKEDSECVAKFGKYGRQGGIHGRPGNTGTCYDFHAPVGTQQLGVKTSYNWPDNPGNSNSECTIL